MTTFEQARALVADRRADAYPAAAQFTVAPWGFETPDRWIVIAGSHTEIYGPSGDPQHDKWVFTDDGPRISVLKADGEYIEEYGLPGISYDAYDDAVEVGYRP